MKNYRKIVKDFINGETKSFRELGLDDHTKVIKVYTIIDEELINFKDSMINQVVLVHNENVFIEDKLHDWYVRNGIFYFFGHSGKKGDKHNLVLVCE